MMAGPEDRKVVVPKVANKAETKAFTGGVDKAQADFNKALKDAKSTLSQANKAGNKEVAASAKSLINQLNTVVKPALDILQKGENPYAAYTGEVAPINKALGGGAPGSGPSGVILGSGGKGAYSLGQIRSYMNANDGALPPDLNLIASGISNAELSNLMNQYKSGTQEDQGDAASLRAAESNAALEKRKSAYDLLMEEFSNYGLGGLVENIKGLVQENVSPSEFAIRLRQTDAYKKRFAANAQRIAQGLGAISEAEYIALEDQYQNVMRQYGLPDTYYTKGDMGRQEGFEKFIANDISAVELEDRIQTAQNRVINANPEVTRALKEFYPDITNGDILAYTLDPKNAIKNIQRKVTAAEIGGAAMGQGLQTSLSRAEELAAAGVDKAAAQQGFQTVAEISPRGSLLSDIYKQGPYGQVQAEQEVFNLAGSAEAARQRKKLTSLETAAFSGQSGVGALARERAGNI
jgi:hypothetical protein